MSETLFSFHAKLTNLVVKSFPHFNTIYFVCIKSESNNYIKCFNWEIKQDSVEQVYTYINIFKLLRLHITSFRLTVELIVEE